MKPYGKAVRLALVPLKGIVVCSLAAGPILLSLEFITDAVRDWSLIYATLGLRWPLSSLASKCAAVSILTLPIVILISLSGYALSKMRGDSFFLVTASGSAIGYIAFCVIGLLSIGQAPGFGFDHPSNVKDAITTLGLSILLSALYWVTVVRRHRSLRMLAEQDTRAIRAME
jgi:hypothetical protein